MPTRRRMFYGDAIDCYLFAGRWRYKSSGAGYLKTQTDRHDDEDVALIAKKTR